MEKRFLSFMLLAFLILFGWQFMLAKLYPEAIKPTTSPTPTATPINAATPTIVPPTTNLNSSNSSDPTSTAPPTPTVNPKQIKVQTSLWEATFDNRGAVLTSFHLRKLRNREITGSDYKELELVSQDSLTKVGAPLRLITTPPEVGQSLNQSLYNVNLETDTINLKDGEEKDLTFTFVDSSGLQAEKKLHFTGGKYLFNLAIKTTRNGQVVPVNMSIGPNIGDQSIKVIDAYVHTPPQMIANLASGSTTYVTGTDLEHRGKEPDANKSIDGKINWLAASDHYFLMAVIPPNQIEGAKVDNNFLKEGEVFKHLLSIDFPVTNEQTYKIFVGPKDRQLLEDISEITSAERIKENNPLKERIDLSQMINYGMFSFMIKPITPYLELLLVLFYRVTHNYGWAILALTLMINLAFFPLKWKSSIAMKKAAKMQPKMKELQEKMKKLKSDDPRMQEIQKEMAQLMREGNPLAGCLPMLIQLPIFWSIYTFLSLSLDVRQSPFILWVRDLSVADHTYILPIIMTVSMMGATALTPTPTSDDPAQKMQKIMMTYIMPIILFALFFSKAPSGLVLYWTFSNVLGFSMQLIINKMTVDPSANNGAAMVVANKK